MTSKLTEVISPPFYEVHRAIKAGRIDELVAKGGRGSTKSTFIAAEIVQLLLRHPECHAVVLRKTANRLRTSVYNQMKWAIRALGLREKFDYTVSPMEITRKSTGQKILFFGLDDPENVKSVKLEFGYIGVLWFEEFSQFDGEEEIRSVEQSALRGGPFAFTFKSFNPPPMMRNWANRYALERKAGRLVHHSTYLDVPPAWLGPRFIMDAEHLFATKPTNYRHEYLGEAVGNGTQVFDNLALDTIHDSKILTFEPIMAGVDWGWYPDPWAFNRVYFDASRRDLYIFDELTRLKTRNEATARLVLGRIGGDEMVYADKSEEKSCADYRDYGVPCRGADKGGGSVRRGVMWLQGLNHIYIDPQRCPDTAKEFGEYEYEVAKDGEILPGYLDRNNHHIDATRYATFRIWNRRGAA
jgi:PBSX family phage terminase large subunit